MDFSIRITVGDSAWEPTTPGFTGILSGNGQPAVIASPTARPISDGVLLGIVETDQRFIRSFFLQLKLVGVRLFAVSCPYPRLDHDCFGHGIRRETARLYRPNLRGGNSPTGWP